MLRCTKLRRKQIRQFLREEHLNSTPLRELADKLKHIILEIVRGKLYYRESKSQEEKELEYLRTTFWNSQSENQKLKKACESSKKLYEEVKNECEEYTTIYNGYHGSSGIAEIDLDSEVPDQTLELEKDYQNQIQSLELSIAQEQAEISQLQAHLEQVYENISDVIRSKDQGFNKQTFS